MIFMPSCSSRELLALVMTPKSPAFVQVSPAATEQPRLGELKYGWLSVLYASARNCACTLSRAAKVFSNDVFTSS